VPPFFERIVTIANMGVVTAADFVPFLGRDNWLSFNRAEDLGADCESFCSGIVYGFKLVECNVRDNTVTIALEMGEGEPRRLLSMTADELAIRMEDS
jgi:hypothetical protein